MDREGFRNRMKQYKLAWEENPGLKYWEWKLKYDSAPKPDNMPSQPKPDTPTAGSQLAENRAHRWDNEHYVDQVNTVFDADRHRSWKEPALKTFGNRVKFTYRDFMKPADVKHMNFLKSIGRLGSALKGASMFGEVVQNLFPSEEAELIEDMRAKMDKLNKWLTGLEDIPKYDEGTDNVMGPPTQKKMFKKKPTIFEDITADPTFYEYVKKKSGRARYERAAHHTGSGDLANVVSYMWDSNDENIPYYTGSYIRGFDPEKDYEGETTAYQGNTTVGQLTTDRTPNTNRDLVKNFIYGEDKGFKKSNKKPLIVNGEVYPDRQYYGNIAPIDTIYLPKSMLPTIDSLIAEKSIYSMNHDSGYTPSFYRQDRMKNYTYDNVAQHSGVFHKNKRNQYSTELFDLWDFMGDYKYGADRIAHAFQKNLEPDQFFPNAGPFVLRQEIPIKFVKDNVLDETRRSGKSFLQNLNDTSNKASIRLKKFVKNWEH